MRGAPCHRTRGQTGPPRHRADRQHLTPQSLGVPPQGSQPSYPSKYCHACGSAIDARAEICPACGVRQPGSANPPGKSRAIAAALALLLGSFGIHKFYLGQVAWGILYLVFFWTYIPGLIGWFEALYFLTRSNEDWARAHGGPVQAPNAVGIGCLWILALWPLLAIIAIASLIFLGGQVSSILSEIATEI
jgi:TM2 domain-containing membrane protein YozV